MSNVIRPVFGKPAPIPGEPAPGRAPAAHEYAPLRVYGKAAGHLVALIRDAAAAEGPVLKVVVGALDADEVEAVALLPATAEGEADADMAAMAILRTLELIEGRGDAGSS